MKDIVIPFIPYSPSYYQLLYQEAAYNAHIKKLHAMFNEIYNNNELAAAAAEKVCLLRRPTKDEILEARKLLKDNCVEDYSK